MAEDKKEIPRPGLGTDPKSKWPKLSPAALRELPIARMKHNTAAHSLVLDYLRERIKLSDDKMRQFHSRWRVNELKYQAYVDLDKFEDMLKDLNENGRGDFAVNITVPYSFAQSILL